MDFTCPKCKAEVTRIPEPPVRAGTEWQCPSCKATVTIPLYCPQCNPASKAKKQFLGTPEGFFPGKTLQCPLGHSFVAKISLNQTHDKLKSLGTEVGQYHQNTRIAALEGPFKRTLGGGFCQGAVLDWIRRALLGGKYAHLNLEDRLTEKSDPTVMNQMRQDRRVANAQVNIANSQKNAIPNMTAQASEMKLKQMADARQKYDDSDEKVRASNLDNDEKNAKLRQLTADLRAAEARAGSLYNKRIEQLTALDGRPAMQHYWKGYAKGMDEYLAADRLARNKKGGSAHAFGSLTPVKSLNSREWAGGISEFARAILMDAQFIPNRAAYVGVGAGRGHAIALHRLNVGNKFHFFDPNFGVYELMASKVLEVMVYLFTIHYPNSMSAGNDDHPYEEKGKVWGEYCIFESALPEAQAVRVDPILVDRNQPQGTVTQLKPIGTQSGTQQQPSQSTRKT